MKTAELTGAALDWAVAKCEGSNSMAAAYYDENRPLCLDEWPESLWEPSTKWSQAGPIIEREAISIAADTAGMFDTFVWFASVDDILVDAEDAIGVRGPTPLIAAMRCYVASKLGDTVEIPSELG